MLFRSEARLETRMRAIEVIDFPGLAGKPMEHPVMKFAGIFKDNPDFIAWHDRFWAEKQQLDTDDEQLSVEELMGML